MSMTIFDAFHFSYYHLDVVDKKSIKNYLFRLIKSTISDLEQSHCVEIDAMGTLQPGIMGGISSYYYLKHRTVRLFNEKLKCNSSLEDILKIVTVFKFC